MLCSRFAAWAATTLLAFGTLAFGTLSFGILAFGRIDDDKGSTELALARPVPIRLPFWTSRDIRFTTLQNSWTSRVSLRKPRLIRPRTAAFASCALYLMNGFGDPYQTKSPRLVAQGSVRSPYAAL
jgi:hypothetical protein